MDAHGISPGKSGFVAGMTGKNAYGHGPTGVMDRIVVRGKVVDALRRARHEIETA